MQFVNYTKGQLKIQQMTFMLLAVTILFILIAIFYISIRTVNLEKDLTLLEREKATALVTKIAATSELTFEGVPRAVDADKLMILRTETEYRDYWEGINGIIVKKLYPKSSERECTFANYPDCDTIKLFTDKNVANIGAYVSVCTKRSKNNIPYDYCELGYLMLEVKNE
jgi:hypothetical protein